jgi:nitrogen regulatory protein PII
MKMVTALLSRQHLKNISSRLSDIGVHGMTLTEVKLSSKKDRGPGPPDFNKKEPDYVPFVKLEIVVRDENANDLTELIRSVASDNDKIAESICIFDIIESVRIRTGEKGAASI